MSWRGQAHFVAEGMAFARNWRDRRDALEQRSALDCQRCEDTGLVLWCGKKGQGGRVGPCPRCQPVGAKRFCTELARETFPEPDIVARARRFDKTFARGVNYGRPQSD